MGFPGGSDSKVPVCNAGDPDSIPGLGRSPGEGNSNTFQYSYPENPIDRGAWWATVHGGAKSRTWLSDFTHTHGFSSSQVWMREWYLMVNSVRIMISKDLASGPWTSLDHSRAFVLQSFIKVWKGTEEATDIDIRRGMENAPLASLSKGAIYLFNWLL